MPIDAWFTVATIVAVFGFLVFSRIGPDLILLGGLLALLVKGVVTPQTAFAGLSNTGVVTIALLFVVAAGMRDTGLVNVFVDTFLRRPKRLSTAQLRVMAPVAAASGFMNNTPLVAMMVPAVSDWARKINVPVSRLLIPLSYAAILGGTCTLIGTSTNLIVDGMAREAGFERLGFFEITRVGLPCAIIAIGFVVLASRHLIPDRSPVKERLAEAREYALEMIVEEGSPLVGKTIEKAGLRHLPGLFLAEIDRGENVLAAVAPTMKLEANDRLVFVGIVESVVDLQKIRGLKPATDQTFKLDAPPASRALIEAVVSNTSPLIGRTIREGRFRNRYNAVVIAVSRNGERVKKKIGDIRVEPGDTMLLEAHPGFVERNRNSRDFYLVSRIEGYAPPRHDRAWMALTILAGLVVAATVFQIDMVLAAFGAAALMLVTGCVATDEAHRSIDWRVLIAIGAALGIGEALRASGAAEVISREFVGLAGGNALVSLILVYLVTVLFTEIVTNNAAAVLIFPIALGISMQLGVDFRPFMIAIMVASSASFITPIGYQTNLMVYGPGGYRFTDFARIGVPTALVVATTALVLIPILFPF